MAALLTLPFLYRVDALVYHHAVWNKPKFLASLMGTVHQEPTSLLLLIKTVNILQYCLQQRTKGLQSIGP